MFQSLGRLLDGKRARELSESDVRHFIQTWLRTTLGVSQVYCEQYRGGTATVRCASPAVRQAIYVAEVDLRRAVQAECGLKLVRVTIRS